MDRYVIVVHMGTGRAYSLNKQLKLNCDAKGVPDAPNIEQQSGTRYEGDFPEVRPDWAKRIPQSDLHAFEVYPLLEVRHAKCRG